jgi:DNA repair and recombination protein RAD52
VTFSDRINQLLSEPLDPSHVETREQAGTTLSYIKGDHAIREMNRIFGYGGWSRRTLRNEITETHTYQNCKKVDMFEACAVAVVDLTVETEGGMIMRSGTGFGNGMCKAGGMHKDAYEGALKEAETDAFKRACVTLGDQFGLALYDKKQRHVRKPEVIPAGELEGTELYAKILAATNKTELQGLVAKMSNQERASYKPIYIAQAKNLERGLMQ